MVQLDEQKALEMLELNADASKDDISRRYGVLTRKFRDIKMDENGYAIEDITQAYNLLMGITFTDKKEEERQKALREHPPLLARVLKKDPVKLENFFHYYKIHMLASLALIVFLFFTIRSCVNRVIPDFNLIIYGEIFTQDTVPLEADIKEKLPELEAPSAQLLSSFGDDPQYAYAMQMKLMAMLSAQDIDILLLDQATYDLLASQGGLLPLDDLVDQLGYAAENYVTNVEVLEEKEDGTLILGPKKIYGIDITQSEYLKNHQVTGAKVIVGIAANSARIDKAVVYLQNLH